MVVELVETLSDDRIRNDPRYQKAAEEISAAHESAPPLSWRIQEDGTLTIILANGKKINEPIRLSSRRVELVETPIKIKTTFTRPTSHHKVIAPLATKKEK